MSSDNDVLDISLFALGKTIFIPPSPAEQMLDEHLKAVAAAQAAHDEAAAPSNRLREELRLAMERLAAAEARVATLGAEETSALCEAAKAGTPIAVDRSKGLIAAENAVARERHAVASLTVALNEFLNGGLTKHVSDLQMLGARTDEIVLAVVIEAHAAALEERASLRDEFVAAEDKVLGLAEAMAARGRSLHQGGSARGIEWLRASTAATTSYGKQQNGDWSPRDVAAAAARWLAVFARLSSDATASW